MPGVSNLMYKDKKILFLDISNCNPEMTAKIVADSINTIRSSPENSVLLLSDLTKLVFNQDSSNLGKSFIKGNKPYIKKSALVGVEGLVKVLFSSFLVISGRDNMKCFDTIEEAKDWLVGE